MPKPFKHPNNATYWYANVGKGKARKLVNLKVLLSEPIEVAQLAVDTLAATDQPQQAVPKNRRTLASLAAEYVSMKQAIYKSKDSRRNFNEQRTYLARILEGCGFTYPDDINRVKIIEWLNGKRGPEFGATTAEKHRKEFAYFCNWLCEEGYLKRKPFKRGDKIRGAIHRKRRVLSAEEKRRLLDAAGRSKRRIGGMAGQGRQLLYSTALATGFRAGELQFLTVSCLHGNRLLLAGRYTKNRDDANQPIPRKLAEALRKYIAGRPPEARIFGKWGRKASRMLKADLAAASIPFKTIDGVADFHALRHTFCTDLIATGVDVKTAQALMRHRSVDMTMSYAKTDEPRKLDAIDRMARADDERTSPEEFTCTVRDAVAENAKGAEVTGGIVRDGNGGLWFVPSGVNQNLIKSEFPEPSEDSELTELGNSLSRGDTPFLNGNASKGLGTVPTLIKLRGVINPQLAVLAAAWYNLPAHVRETILTIAGVPNEQDTGR